MKEYISELDSERFGFKVAKVNDWGANPKKLLTNLDEQNVQLIIARIPSEEIVTLNELESLGFHLKDLQLTYRYKLKNLSFDSLELPAGITIREARETDMRAIANISKQAFLGYGHYSANTCLDQSKVNSIYEDWALRSFHEPNVADKFFIASGLDDEVAGFLTFKIVKTNNQSYAAGGIGAVGKQFQNQGIFKLLVKYGLLWGKQLNLDWEEHNALATNYPVGKVFTSLGFHIESSCVTLHRNKL